MARINTVTEFADSSRTSSFGYSDVAQLWQIANDNGGICVGSAGKPISEPRCCQPNVAGRPRGQSIFREE